ncbi:MAG: hypothetical protein HOY69_41160, partial [Streptomyces sp.]|nr:hypothetical protein [Streptomyces sp.]
MSDHSDGTGYGYGHGDPQGRGHDEQAYGGAAPYPADGTYVPETYVPEPLPSALPPQHDQGTPFGAPPPGDDWTGHAAGQDGAGYGTPAPGDGWAGTPAAAHPWTAPQEYPQGGDWQAPYPESAGYGTAADGTVLGAHARDAGYGDAQGHGGTGYAAPGHETAGFDAGAPWQQPHAYAYANADAQPHAAEHTAV